MAPRVALTVGDPAGIGPEIARKAAADPRVLDACEPVIVGPSMRRARRFRPGVLSAEAGRAAYDAIVDAVEQAKAGRVDAIATAPVNKEAFALAGLALEGAHRSARCAHRRAPGGDDVRLADAARLAGDRAHPAGRRAAALTTRGADRDDSDHRREPAAISGSTRRGSRWPGSTPRRRARPDGARGRGRDRAGDRGLRAPMASTLPARFPATRVFLRASRGEFDAVIACYHDQGLIPVKLLSFGRSVNVTLGLPIVRTSVDHGTAFDIAGQDRADPSSMVEAVLLAARLARNRGSAGDDRTALKPVGLHDPWPRKPNARRPNACSPTIARRSTTTRSSRASRPAWRCSAPRSNRSARDARTCATATRGSRAARCGRSTSTSARTRIAATSITSRCASASCCCTRPRSAS